MTNLAVSMCFLDAFSRLPAGVRSKVRNCIKKCHDNPTAVGLHYEKIEASTGDDRMRSLRVDKNYRCIIFISPESNLRVLLYVDSHDEAYSWAKRHTCHIDDGIFSVVALGESTLVPKRDTQKARKITVPVAPWVAALTLAQLEQLGVPEPLFKELKAIRFPHDLERLQERISSRLYEQLLWLQDGEKFEDVVKAYSSEKEEERIAATKQEDDPYLTALRKPRSLQFFVLNPSGKELVAMFDAPLEHWRIFLHPTQRLLVERDWNGPVRVLGGAGTGKTVVAVHRAKWLAANRCPEGKKILFTTFTKTLVADLERQLASICTEGELAKIEVVNVDKWLGDFLKSNSYPYRLAYLNDRETIMKLEEIFRVFSQKDATLTKFDGKFLLDEWRRTIQANEVMTLEEYYTVSRKGRKTPLSRKAKKSLWAIFEEFRHYLRLQRVCESPDGMREARLFVKQGAKKDYYSSIIIDEAQDMSASAFRLLRELVPQGANDIFLVGDAHQRIYGQPVVLSSCDIVTRGREKKLRLNYRTTEEIKKWAVRTIQEYSFDDLNGHEDPLKGDISLFSGSEPTEKRFTKFSKLVKQVIVDIKALMEGKDGVDIKDICVVSKTNKSLDELEAAFKKANIVSYRLASNQPEDRAIAGVRLSSMHRVKGLEFSIVFLLDTESDDHEDDDLNFIREKALRYVAATRARIKLFVYSY